MAERPGARMPVMPPPAVCSKRAAPWGTLTGQPEVAPGFGYVFKDLRLQGLRRGPSNFAAQTQQKFQIDLGLLVHLDRLEVKNVRFDGKRRLAKGGPVADVGHGLEAATSNGQAGDVN